jgi:hypothetical protein
MIELFPCHLRTQEVPPNFGDEEEDIEEAPARETS